MHDRKRGYSLKKAESKPLRQNHPRIVIGEFLLAFAAALLLCGAAYALYGAATMKSALDDSAARTAAASVRSVLGEAGAAYSDDLRSLHLKTDAQDTRFDELCALLARTARNNNLDSLVTIARRTGADGYAYILDSRFSRKLTPNVDYHTVGAACDLRQEGGTQLERLVARIESGEQEYGYATAPFKEGAPAMICAFTLYNSDGSAMGIVLARITGGLFARKEALALPFYVLAALLLAACLFTLLMLWLRHRKANRAVAAAEPVETTPLEQQEALPEDTIPEAEN